jgi:phosphomannomutase/phosphoglucomutase
VFDVDGDRVGVIDDKGNEIFSDKIGLLIARHLSDQYKNSKFVVDVKSTGLFGRDKKLAANSCETTYWKTGHSYIKRKVNEEKALAGFEKSGHFFFNKPLGLGYDDGILSAIQVCKMLDSKLPKKISDLLNELPTTYQSPTMAPYCADEVKYEVVKIITEKFKTLLKNKNKICKKLITEILTVNGIRFTLCLMGLEGLFEDALISPQDPSSKVNLIPFTVKISVINFLHILFLFFSNVLNFSVIILTTSYFTSSAQ